MEVRKDVVTSELIPTSTSLSELKFGRITLPMCLYPTSIVITMRKDMWHLYLT